MKCISKKLEERKGWCMTNEGYFTDHRSDQTLISQPIIQFVKLCRSVLWNISIRRITTLQARVTPFNSKRSHLLSFFLKIFFCFVWGFLSHSRNFHSYGDVTSPLPMKGCKVWHNALELIVNLMSCYYSLKKKKVSNVAHVPVVGPIHTSPHRVLEKMDWGGGVNKGPLICCF